MVTAERAREITEQNSSPIFQQVTRNIIKTATQGCRSFRMNVDGYEMHQIENRLKSLGYELIEDDYIEEQNTYKITISW